MRVLLGVVFFLFMLAAGQADTVRREAPANKTSVIGAHSIFNSTDCTAGAIPQLTLVKKPKNGDVTFKRHSYKLGESSGRCEGKRVNGMLVVYTPKKGFRGEDTFKIGFLMHRYTSASRQQQIAYKYVVDVK